MSDHSNNFIPRSRFNTTAWNRFRYSLWAPVYDLVVGGVDFRRQRQRAAELLALRQPERALLVGAGTGQDLDYIPPEIDLTAIDVTPAMLARLQRRAARLGRPVDVRVMDGAAMAFPGATFDAVILHLILAVMPDPARCAREVSRVLKPGGRAVVFDKWLPAQGRLHWGMRFAAPLWGLLAGEVTRRLEPILDGSGLQIAEAEPAGWGGLFQIALLRKAHASEPARASSPKP